MINNNFWALQAKDELQDTLYFAGLDYQVTKTEGAKRAYVFTTTKFCLTISGRSITMDGVKIKSLREAKQRIAESVI